MPSRPFRVGRSSTGLGLFAIESIEKKAVVVIYRGRLIPTPLAHERERRYGAKYMFEINRRWTIDGSSRRNLARYINHSCAANTESVLRKGKMEFVALRRIAPGEEITLDYVSSMHSDRKRCTCKAPDCRGTINKSTAGA